MFKLLSQNVAIYGFTNLIKSLVPLLMLPILTAHLSLTDFGTLSLIETNILFLSPFILLNINSAINVEYYKLERETLKEYITNALLLSFISFLILSVVFFFLKSTLHVWLNLNEDIVVLLSLFVVLRVIGTVVLGVMQMGQEVRKFAAFSLFQTLIDFGLSYLFVVYLQSGYLGRLEGVYAAFLITSIIGLYFLIKNNYIGRVNFRYSKSILKFGVPLIPHAIGGTVMAMSDRYFIAYYFGNQSVGLYTIAYQMSAVMLLISMSVNQAWTPMLFKLLKEKFIKRVITFTVVLAIAFLLAGLCVYFLQDILFDLFIDEKFWEAKEYYLFLLLGFVFQSLYFLVTNLLFFEKKTSLLASITITGACLNLILNYFLINEFGVIGVAYATCITWFIFLVSVLTLNVYILKKVVKNDQNS